MFQARLAQCGAQITACQQAALEEFGDGALAEAMAYALDGGKRLRGFLVMEAARLHGVADAQSVWAAAAVEAMHGYSLIHDDLPCMDDDDLRRGRATVHIKWDESTAVLAGDALQAWAFELLSRDELSRDAGVRLALIGLMARAAGAAGMVLGQAMDVAAEQAAGALDLDEITRLQANKTGALIVWSAQAGAVLGGADPGPLRAYASALGLAFQIADDILDVEGDARAMGKRLGKDADANKATFVSLLGLEAARRRADVLVDEAVAALTPYGVRAAVLQQAARFVISRGM